MNSFLEEALDQARQTMKVYSETSKPSAASLRFLIGRMERAQRIRLATPLVPEGHGMEMLAQLDRYAEGIVLDLRRDLLIEYEHGGIYDVAIDPTRALSTRRMVLLVPMETEWAVTLDGAPARPVDPHDRGALLIWSINYFEEKLEWEFAPSAVILPKAQAFAHLQERGSRWSRLAKQWIDCARAGLKAKATEGGGSCASAPIQVLYQDMIPELIRQLDQHSLQRIARELGMDACWAALGVLSALACQDVALPTREGFKSGLDGVDGEGVKTPMWFGARSSTGVDSGVPVDPFRGQWRMDAIGRLLWSQPHQGLVGPIQDADPSPARVVSQTQA